MWEKSQPPLTEPFLVTCSRWPVKVGFPWGSANTFFWWFLLTQPVKLWCLRSVQKSMALQNIAPWWNLLFRKKIKSIPQAPHLLCLEFALCCVSVCTAKCPGLLLLEAVLHSVLRITALLFTQAAVLIGLDFWSLGLLALLVPQGTSLVRYQLAESLFIISFSCRLWIF